MPTFIDRNLPGERGVIAKSLGQLGLITARLYPTVVSYQARDFWRSLSGRDFDREASLRAREDPRGPQQTELYCAEGKQVQNSNGQSFVDLDVTGVKHGRLAIMMCNYLRINPNCRGAEFEVQVDGVLVLRQSFSRRELEQKRVFFGPQLQIRRETGEISISFSAFPRDESCPPRLAFVMRYSRDRLAEHPHKDPFASRRLIWADRELQREKSIDEQPPPRESLRNRDRSPHYRHSSSSRQDARRNKRSHDDRYERYDRRRDRDQRSSRHDHDDEARQKRPRVWGTTAKELASDAEIRKAIDAAFAPPPSSTSNSKTAEKQERATALTTSQETRKESKEPHDRPTDARMRAFSPVSTLSDRFDFPDGLKLPKPEQNLEKTFTSYAPPEHRDQANTGADEPSKTSSTSVPSATKPAPLGSPISLDDLQTRNAALETEMVRLRLLCDNRRLQREVELLRQELEGKQPSSVQDGASYGAYPAAVTSALSMSQVSIGPAPAKKQSQQQQQETETKTPPPKPITTQPTSSPADCGSSVVPSEAVSDGTDRSAHSATISPMTSIGSSYGGPDVDQKLMGLGALLGHGYEGPKQEYFQGPASAPAYTSQ